MIASDLGVLERRKQTGKCLHTENPSETVLRTPS